MRDHSAPSCFARESTHGSNWRDCPWRELGPARWALGLLALLSVAVPPVQAFQPTDLAGCQHWYRADLGAGLDAGNGLQSWTNQGLAEGAFAQGSASLRPTVVVDPQFGVASVLFDGTDDFLESDLPAGDWALLHNGHGNDGVTVFLVFYSAAEVQNQVLLQTSRNSSVARTGGSYRYRTGPAQSGLIAYEVNDGSSSTRVLEANTGFGSVPLGKVHSLATRFRSDLFDLHVDLVPSVSGTPQGSASGAPFGTARISSQSGPGSAAQFIDGHLFELIVYNRFLDDGELATVHGYLNDRYRIRGKRSFTAELKGFEEPPSVSSTGSGEFRARISRDETSIEFELTYEDLEGTTTLAAHVHLGQKSVNGGVSFFLCGGGGRPPCTPTSGTFTGTVTASDVIGPTAQGIAPGELAEIIRAMRAGVTYANVHTDKHPGGEIRGQIK